MSYEEFISLCRDARIIKYYNVKIGRVKPREGIYAICKESCDTFKIIHHKQIQFTTLFLVIEDPDCSTPFRMFLSYFIKVSTMAMFSCFIVSVLLHLFVQSDEVVNDLHFRISALTKILHLFRFLIDWWIFVSTVKRFEFIDADHRINFKSFVFENIRITLVVVITHFKQICDSVQVICFICVYVCVG